MENENQEMNMDQSVENAETAVKPADLMPRSKLTLSFWIGFFGVALVVMSLLSMIGFPFSYTNVSAISLDELEVGKAYFADELIIVDVYASDEEETEFYFVALFFDKDGNIGYVSLAPRYDGELSDEWLAYAFDEEALIGDEVVSGYFFVESWPEDLLNLHDYYEEGVFDYQQDVLGGENTDHYAVYVCGAEENLQLAYFRNEVFGYAITFGVGLIFAVIGFVVYAKSRRKKTDI